jgi:hypothetical protein
LAGLLSRSIKQGSAGAEAASGAGCDGATVRLGATAARRDEVSAARGGRVSAARGGALSAGRAAGRGLGGASGVLAITLTSGRPTGLSSANTGSPVASRGYAHRGEQTPGHHTRPQHGRATATANLGTHTQPRKIPHDHRFDFRTSIATCLVKSSNPHENSDGVTTETHKPSLPLTKNGGSIRQGGPDWSPF